MTICCPSAMCGTVVALLLLSGCSGCANRTAAATDLVVDLPRHDSALPDVGQDQGRPRDRGVVDFTAQICGAPAPTPQPPVEIPWGEGVGCGVGCRQVSFGGSPVAKYDVSGSYLVYRSVFDHIHLVDLAKNKEWRICEDSDKGSCGNATVDATRVAFTYYHRKTVASMRFFSYELASGAVKEIDCSDSASCNPQSVALGDDGMLTSYSFINGCSDAAYWLPFATGKPVDLAAKGVAFRKAVYVHADKHLLTWTEVGKDVFRMVVYDTQTSTRRELSRYPDDIEFDGRLDGNRLVALYKPVSMGGHYATDRRNTDIVLYELDSGKRTVVSAYPSRQEHPDISDDTVVWYDWRNNPGTITPDDGQAMANADIYLKNLKSGKEQQLTCGSGYEMYPLIEGRKVYFRARGKKADGSFVVALFEVDLVQWDGNCIGF